MDNLRILIIQLRQLGDILLTTPCARELKRGHPGCHITFLCEQMGRKVLTNNPHIDELLTYSRNDGVRQKVALLGALRRQRFDLVLDFMNNPRSAVMSLASGAPRRGSFRQRLVASYTDVAPRDDSQGYIVAHKFSLLRHFGFTPQDHSLVFSWEAKDLGPYRQLVSTQTKFREAPLRVVLSPTHRREIRRWPVERYAALADHLSQSWKASVTWIWGPGEEAEIDAVMQMGREPSIKAPATSFAELVALLAQHDVFIGNSNGPSHLAVAADICSLQLHGHTSARSWCPETAKHHSLQTPEFGRVAMPTLEGISLEAVINKLDGMMPIIRKQAQKRHMEHPK